MKKFLFLIFISFQVIGSTLPQCGMNLIRVYMPGVGMSCVPRYQSQLDPFCSPWQTPMVSNPFQGFPGPLFQSQVQPWWAYQGNMYYPNMNYPGPWQYPGIQAQYYPGQGEVFAAKPNVYIDSIHETRKFNFKFTSETKPHFLATTPVLGNNLTWSGKIVENDKFEVGDVRYDYLFYDVRLPKDKMQFTNGVCATRDASIEWMMNDLKEMKFSAISLQDFEEHWRVKIPDYPFYCIYPQYNRELDPILPVEIDIEQNTFIRSLYVLVPHKTEPDMENPQEIPFPIRDPGEYRPGAKIQRENSFREWGVAFLGY
jgi:hypothetical protein